MLITWDYSPDVISYKYSAPAKTHNQTSLLTLYKITPNGACLLQKILASRSFYIFHVASKVLIEERAFRFRFGMEPHAIRINRTGIICLYCIILLRYRQCASFIRSELAAFLLCSTQTFNLSLPTRAPCIYIFHSLPRLRTL
jgi:hypothetical protein